MKHPGPPWMPTILPRIDPDLHSPWSLDLSMLDRQEHSEQEQPTQSYPRQQSSKGCQRPSGNEASQDKETLNHLVQQAKLSFF